MPQNRLDPAAAPGGHVHRGAAGKGSEARQIVALLFAAGADPSTRNKRGRTAGDYATDEEMRALLSGGRNPAKAGYPAPS